MPSYSGNLMFWVNPFCTPPHTLEGGVQPLTSLTSILENSSVLLVNFFGPPREGQQTDYLICVVVLIRASPLRASVLAKIGYLSAPRESGLFYLTLPPPL